MKLLPQPPIVLTQNDNLHKLFFELRDKFGQTFVIVTHNEELADLADRKLTMVDGLITSSDVFLQEQTSK